jgi:tetratricopeptide (TPR) repeat protein
MVPIPCIHRVFEMDVNPMLVKVANADVVYSGRKRASTDMRWCRPDEPPMSDDALIVGAMDRILGEIRQDVAPYNAVLRATVKEDSKGLPEGAAKDFDAAVKAAGKADMSEACRLWGEVDRVNPNHVWTVYDLGVCAEANGNYAGAVAFYERARTLSPKPDRDVAESIERASTLLAAHQELKREGHPSGVPQTVQAPAPAATTPPPPPAPVVTAAHAKLVKTYGAKVAGWIEKHEVHNGMTAAAVLAARGAPTKRDAVTAEVDVWSYGAQKIVFTKGKVTSVGK